MPIPQNQIMISSAITDNPFRILGVYSNATAKDIAANQGKMKAFLSIGKTPTFELDLRNILPSVNRTTDSVSKAQADLTLPQDKLQYALFWFLKATPLDDAAFNHLFAGEEGKAITIWEKKECLSSLINIAVCALINKDYKTATDNINTLIYDDELLLEFVSRIAGTTFKIDSEDIAHLYLDILSKDTNINWCDYIDDINWCNYLKRKEIDPLISDLNSKISTAEKASDKNKNAYEIGRDLMNSTKDSIHRLHELLDENDIQLTSIADNLGLTILRYGIDYYNNNSDNEDCAYKAKELQDYASSIVMGTEAQKRCNDNVKILNKNIAELPPKSVKIFDSELNQKVESFLLDSNGSINKASLFIEQIAPILVKIKEVTGVKHTYYQKICDLIAHVLSNFIVEKVNYVLNDKYIDKAQRNNDYDEFKTVMSEAWHITELLTLLSCTSREAVHLSKNRDDLKDIINQFHGFWTVHINPLDGCCASVEHLNSEEEKLLYTEYEYIHSCSSTNDYEMYINKYPNGKYLKEAQNKIEDLYFHYNTPQEYLTEYPHGRHAVEARNKLDNSCFQNARSCEDFINYTKKYPNGIHISEVDDTAFKKCKSISDFSDYIKFFQKGNHTSEAYSKKEDLIYYAIYDIKDCFHYISKYPHGKYLAEVDKKAFFLCKKYDDYKLYIKMNPNGLYIKRVQTKINIIKCFRTILILIIIVAAILYYIYYINYIE
jgi:hypothetical protein